MFIPYLSTSRACSSPRSEHRCRRLGSSRLAGRAQDGGSAGLVPRGLVLRGWGHLLRRDRKGLLRFGEDHGGEDGVIGRPVGQVEGCHRITFTRGTRVSLSNSLSAPRLQGAASPAPPLTHRLPTQRRLQWRPAARKQQVERPSTGKTQACTPWPRTQEQEGAVTDGGGLLEGGHEVDLIVGLAGARVQVQPEAPSAPQLVRH